MDHLPVFLRVHDRTTVVVGGGPVAARKAELLLKCGARVRLVAPELHAAARALLAAAGERISHLSARFEPAHLADAMLVVAATDSAELNASVARAARERDLPVNVVDDPALSSFILPAIVDRSPVIVAMSSAGQRSGPGAALARADRGAAARAPRRARTLCRRTPPPGAAELVRGRAGAPSGSASSAAPWRCRYSAASGCGGDGASAANSRLAAPPRARRRPAGRGLPDRRRSRAMRTC